jgi:pyridoxal biosynthesis lyase PdxS
MPDHSGDVTPQPEPFDPRSRAIVQAVTHYTDANVIAEVSRDTNKQ